MNVFRRQANGYEKVRHSEEDRFINDSERLGDDLRRPSPRRSRRRKLFALGGLCVLGAIVTSFLQREEVVIVQTSTERVDPDALYLHMLIHSNKKDANLCKSLVSAGALNYPLPSLLNWGTIYNDTSALNGGAHLAQVDSVLDYLNLIRRIPRRDNDVVIIVDGYDTWFQLRPDVMLERFFEINRHANNRVVKKMGQAVMDSGGIQHKIVFGSQRNCSASPDEPACYAAPPNPYGKLYGDKESERYLNSRFIMGELGPLTRLYERARWHWDQDRANSTVQGVMSFIFGEQEFQRELIHRRYNSPNIIKRIFQYIGLAERGILDAHPTRKRPKSSGEAEFLITLDYGSLLSTSTGGESDLDFLVRNDTESLTKIKETTGIKPPSSLYQLPSDILRSLEPFWARNPTKKLPQDLNWEDTSLYTNLWTGTIPASIQHTSPRNQTVKELAEASLRHKGWKQMWFHDYMRPLLDEHINEPYRSIAVLESEMGGEVAWWPLHLSKWRLRDHDGNRRAEKGQKKEWLPWKAFCEGDGVEDEVFGVGKPAWKAPRLEY